MSRGKFQTRRRRMFPVFWILLILALMGTAFGGVWAYLSLSAEPVSNTFAPDTDPVVSVDGGYQVTVSNTQYAVYLRAAVVVNWKSTDNGSVIFSKPVEGVDYKVNGDWSKLDGDFYYYKEAVTNGTIDAPIVTLTGIKTGYTLVADVAVQAVQAIGQTDDGTKSAVEDAWGISY